MWDPEASYNVRSVEGWLEKRGEKGVSLYLKAKQQKRYFRTSVREGVPVLNYYMSSDPHLEPVGQIYFGRGRLLVLMFLFLTLG
jgi:hypothetical protein